MNSIPTINIANLLTQQKKGDAASFIDLVNALHNIGFVAITGHGIEQKIDQSTSSANKCAVFS